jgi:hypothetical protein
VLRGGIASVAVAVLILLSGCGGGENPGTTSASQPNSVVLQDAGAKTGASPRQDAKQETRCSPREFKRLKQVAEAHGLPSNAEIGCAQATVTDKLPKK